MTNMSGSASMGNEVQQPKSSTVLTGESVDFIGGLENSYKILSRSYKRSGTRFEASIFFEIAREFGQLKVILSEQSGQAAKVRKRKATLKRFRSR